MENNSSSLLQSIDAAVLTPIVRQSLGRQNIQILDWQVKQLGGGIGNPVSVGLFRFAGRGQDLIEQIDWSVVLKIIQSPANSGWEDMGEGDDQAHWNYWKRELLVFRSGFLDSLPEGLSAPRCYGTTELPGNITWLWMEEIIDSEAGAWPLEHYALTARLLGRLNGSYLSGRRLPDFPWLGKNLLRQWVNSMPWQNFPWDHPRSLTRYPRPEENPFRHMLLEIERFMSNLDLLPKTICHGDTYPTNFKFRQTPGSRQEIVALDWALMGLGVVGEDLGQLVFGAQTNLVNARRDDIVASIFESYLDGLRDSGCRIDPEQVLFGFKTTAALRVGLFQLFLLGDEIDQDETLSKEAVTHPPVSECFEVAMAKDALTLLEEI